MVTTKTALITYVPVIHAGYLKFFVKYPEADLVIVDKELLSEQFRSILKDIRALETGQIIDSLRVLLPTRNIIYLQDKTAVRECGDSYERFIMPEDEISEWLEQEFFAEQKVEHDSIFLRWSSAKTKQKQDVAPDDIVTTDELHQQMMGLAIKETEKSSDWWRQTAAAVAKDGQLIALAHNQHAPLDQVQYLAGDPRANSSRGMAIEVSTAAHAEEIVIARAAATGVSLEGADLYVTTFPCPYCARLIAYAGIKRLFYKDGYSVLDGAELMKNRGVELIKVEYV